MQMRSAVISESIDGNPGKEEDHRWHILTHLSRAYLRVSNVP